MATPKSASKKRGAAAKKGGNRSAKAGLIFPVGRFGSLLRRGQYARRVGASSAVYLAAVVEYLVAELLELTVKAAAQQKNKSKRDRKSTRLNSSHSQQSRMPSSA